MNKAQNALEKNLKQNPKQGEKLKEKTEKKLKKLKSKCDTQIKQVNDGFERSTKLLLDSYDHYLKDSVPAPSFLPVTVTVLISSKKNIKLDNVTLRATDSTKELEELIKKRLKELDDPLLAYPSKCKYILKRPWSTSSNTTTNTSAAGGNAMDVEVEIDEGVPIAQYKAENGSTILVVGEIKLKSDQPKECFTADYKVGMMCDYYRCKNCNFNWICKNCAETCHANHTIIEFMKAHKPKWACCYCVKYKTCKIPNNKTKK